MINLIPPQLKRTYLIRKRINYFSSTVFSCLILSVLVFFLATYLNYNFKLKLEKTQGRVETAKKESARFSDLEEKINQTNAKLIKIDSVDKTRVLWSVVLTELANCTPQDVRLQNLSLDQNSAKIALTGEAETRREIAKYKEKLESSQYFKNIVFISSALNEQKNNYSFSMTAELEKTR